MPRLAQLVWCEDALREALRPFTSRRPSQPVRGQVKQGRSSFDRWSFIWARSSIDTQSASCNKRPALPPIHQELKQVGMNRHSNRHTPPKGSASCVQSFDDSQVSAIRITYRISLRSSSLWEPRHPLLKVLTLLHFRPGRRTACGPRARMLLLLPSLDFRMSS